LVTQRRSSWRRSLLLTGAALPCAAVLSSCDRSPSALDPTGPKSNVVAVAWWILFGVAVFVCVLVIVMTLLAVFLRRRARKVSTSDARGFVMGFGVIFPAVVLAATFGLSIVTIAKNADPPTTPGSTVEVIGHKWWWEVRYPGTPAVTANEIHVPVGTPVRLRLETADVIHSFWVPQLMPKMDLIPGRINDTWLTADKTGSFRGQCAEYCGLQHAHMAFSVVVQQKAAYQRWLADQSSTARTPTSSYLRHGMQVVTNGTCATCHTIRGTPANGTVGPDLTHLASRSTIAAGTLPLTKGNLGGWIANSQAVKPGNRMPPQHLSPNDLRAAVDYLLSLE
jgi:cytochrome c oxidase subunit 2